MYSSTSFVYNYMHIHCHTSSIYVSKTFNEMIVAEVDIDVDVNGVNINSCNSWGWYCPNFISMTPNPSGQIARLLYIILKVWSWQPKKKLAVETNLSWN